MKQSIRKNVFETNSSSEHSLSISNEWQLRDLLDDIKYHISNADSKEDLYTALGKLDKVRQMILDTIEEI